MHEPLIQILLPTYEPQQDFLCAALASVITQTEQRWTLSINDDASTTDVHTLVEPYLKDPRITFTRNVKRLGIGGNWNICLKKVFEPKTYHLKPITYVQFLFQDDLWHPTYLRRALSILETHPTVGCVSIGHHYECEKNLAVKPLYDHLQETRTHLLSPGLHRSQEFLLQWLEHGLHPNLIGEPSFVMMRRDLVEHVGLFDENMPQFLDVEYWTRCLAQTDWYYLKENLGTFRVHAKGASERNRREGRGMIDRLLCAERAIQLLPKNTYPNRANILSRTLREMIGKFQRERRQKNIVKNPLRLLPILPFCLRHPILIVSASLKQPYTRKRRPL